MTFVDAMMLLAVLVIVPAAIPLHPAGSARVATVAAVAGLPAVPAHVIDQGPVAAALVAPWLIAALVGAFLAIRWWRLTGFGFRDVVWAAAALYLVVAAVWLVADRLDLQLAGFPAPFVQLTAIHFHYAGFASAVLVACAWRACPRSHTAAAAAWSTVAAPPIIAAGFAYFGLLQVVGAVLLTLGLWLLAWVTIRHVVPRITWLARTLLLVSCLAVLVPMALAVQWAVGINFATPALSIPDMVLAHGATNAVGFTLPGVLGWRLAQPDIVPGA